MDPCSNCGQVDDGVMLAVVAQDIYYSMAPPRIYLRFECLERGAEWKDAFVLVDRVITKLGKEMN